MVRGGPVAAALRQLERRAAREVRGEAVEQDVLAVARAPHGQAQRGRGGAVQRQQRAVHQRGARQHHGVRRAPPAAVAPRHLPTDDHCCELADSPPDGSTLPRSSGHLSHYRNTILVEILPQSSC